ncbi:hypothetical protein [Kitasatospora phosalacinea]|uniref:Uncharacterized protein n=1 Tax=Kitasatospora phosalacinea TaxID=2065 RepID=A0ABW6GWE1_9ACTN
MTIRHPGSTVRPLRADERESRYRSVEAAGVQVRVRVVRAELPWGAARLWEFLLDLDLTERVEAHDLPVARGYAAAGGPASCVRTGVAAELALDVRELGSA